MEEGTQRTMIHDEPEILRRVERRNESLREQYGPGFVIMRRCFLCGYTEFAESRPSEPNGIRIDAMGRLADCVRCTEIHHRSPEVFDWICGVVQYMHEDRVARVGKPGSLRAFLEAEKSTLTAMAQSASGVLERASFEARLADVTAELAELDASNGIA